MALPEPHPATGVAAEIDVVVRPAQRRGLRGGVEGGAEHFALILAVDRQHAKADLVRGDAALTLVQA
jgi:hypothetical protein